MIVDSSFLRLKHHVVASLIPSKDEYHRTILVTITLQLSLLLPTLIRLIFRYHMKEPYHTSILSGYAWVQELLNGHLECIHTVTGLSICHVGERFQRENWTISK